ncbi:sulfatase [Rubinisphaera sp.]|uniref:sulfatase n=1 Tax=Rubinisphaera sp. TaxID=2024857 RepID=UPI000C0D7BD6|nr:sulfatase [Rubinisphaera sp.]MBV11410.1 aryl-sulfate sulfohydrolase [Rubinisphaera sp.]HCS51666.1 aryl-sulfate sulfohydrolase [Planctomycetaceae bacterium]
MRRLILLACLVLFTSIQLPSLDGGERPNILYINADDLGIQDVSYNSNRYRTPNIDRLASEGMTFTQAYAPAANCAPSRSCCMTGQNTPRHGVYTVGNSDRGKSSQRKLIPIKNSVHIPQNQETIAEILQANGYKTIHLGKWHITRNPIEKGFDVNIGGNDSGSPTGGYFSPFKKGSMKSYNNQYPAGTHRVDIFADQAVKFLRKHRDDPFFMYMSYYSVHTGIEPVPEFVGKYKGKGVDAAYASMIEKMDQGIGKILSELDSLGLKDNTFVVFSSDNGGVQIISSQSPFRAGKGSYFEGGVRVPVVVRWPGKVEPGSINETPVTGLDFFPTFLDVAGIDSSEQKILDGQSLVPLLTGKGQFAERKLYWHFPIYLQGYGNIKKPEEGPHDSDFRTRPGSVVRDGKWKLHEYFEDGRLELYDLEADIGEQYNLVESHPEITSRIHADLKQWRKSMNAPVPTKLNPDYQPQ